MHNKIRIKFSIVTLIILLGTGISLLIAARGGGSIKGMILFTQVPVAQHGEHDDATGAWRFPAQSRIVAIDTVNTKTAVKVITEGFIAARAPYISYDGERMLFAGKRQNNDSWQIWEMRLDNLKVRQVTSGFEACTDPAYLPDGRIVFAAIRSENSNKDNNKLSGAALYTCALDGSGAERITFHPEPDFAPTLLSDGRLLFVSSKSNPSGDTAALFTMRYDGTGLELIYESPGTIWQIARAWETDGRQVVFIESRRMNIQRDESENENAIGGRLVAVALKRPLHSRIDLAPEAKGKVHSAFPLHSGQLLVSYRPPDDGRFSLYMFDLTKGRPGKVISNTAGYHAVEPVLAMAHSRPKSFVSLVDPQKKSATVYCLNANLSDMPITNATADGKRVQVSGINGILGEAPLEEDGSFYIEVPADTPLRFSTIGENGKIVRGPSAWIWLRPNKQRGCIGCHEDRELAPENRVPIAVARPPVSLLPKETSLAVAKKSLKHRDNKESRSTQRITEKEMQDF